MTTILITGASSGLGRSIAEHLSNLPGYTVFGTSRKGDNGPAKVKMLALDITSDASVSQAVSTMITQAGKIDVLINNAGAGLCGAVEDCALDEARWQIDINFFGAVRMIQAVLPHMRQQSRGRIISISSIAGQIALPFQSFYSASKYALEGLNDALRLELHNSGIDCTLIEPGDFATGFTSARVFSRHARSGNHAEQLNKTVAIYERDETKGTDPLLAATLCARLIQAPSLKPRYAVGRWDQRLGLIIKRLIPGHLFEKIMRTTYKIN